MFLSFFLSFFLFFFLSFSFKSLQGVLGIASILFTSGLAFNSLGDIARCEGTKGRHTCLIETQASFGNTINTLCLPQQCTSDVLATVNENIKDIDTSQPFLDKCFTPYFFGGCMAERPKNENVNKSKEICAGIGFTTTETLASIAQNVTFHTINFHCGNNKVEDMDAAAAVVTTLFVMLGLFCLLDALIEYFYEPRLLDDDANERSPLLSKSALNGIGIGGGGGGGSGGGATGPGSASGGAGGANGNGSGSVSGKIFSSGSSEKSGGGGGGGSINGSKALDINSINLDSEGRPAKVAFWRKFLACFSVRQNFQSLAQNSPSRSLNCLDGLRTLSMVWIILGHTIDFMDTPFADIDNVEFEPQYLGRGSMQFATSAHLGVDTFFFISGLLTVYVMLKRFEKKRKLDPPHLAIILRWLRLVPLLGFVLALYVGLVPYFGEGPMWYRMVHETNFCRTYWWTNLAFVNNFYPNDFHVQCLPWTWYLADDMQYFIICLVIMIIYCKVSKTLGWVVCVGLMALGIISTAVISQHYDLDLSVGALQDYVYDKPYTRVTTYVMGMMFAFYLVDHIKGRKIVLSRKVAFFWMTLSLTLLFTCIYCTYRFFHYLPNKVWSQSESSAYLALVRPGFILAISGIVFLSLTKNGGPVGWFLTLSIWEPLGKLTFAAYLLHPIIIRTVYYNEVSLIHLSDIEVIHYAGFFIPISFLMASIFFVCVEVSFSNVVDLLVGKPR